MPNETAVAYDALFSALDKLEARPIREAAASR